MFLFKHIGADVKYVGNEQASLFGIVLTMIEFDL